VNRVHALLLAAGQGARFGGNKLLAPLHGRPLIAHAAGTLAQAIMDGVLAGGVAVISPGAAVVLRALDTTGLTLVENPDAAAGMATSLQHGLQALAVQEPRVDAALIVLADQPGLRLDVIAAVVSHWARSGGTTRPRYAASPDEPGHPVLLDRADWPLANRLTGDQGLRHLLAGRPVTLVDVPGVNPDVDTPADLRRLEDTR
jgi:molybdenum cofactor cytidylyltransferase